MPVFSYNSPLRGSVRVRARTPCWGSVNVRNGVNSSFQIIPRSVGRLGSEPHVVGRLGSGPQVGVGGYLQGVFSVGEVSPGGYLLESSGRGSCYFLCILFYKYGKVRLAAACYF